MKFQWCSMWGMCAGTVPANKVHLVLCYPVIMLKGTVTMTRGITLFFSFFLYSACKLTKLGIGVCWLQLAH